MIPIVCEMKRNLPDRNIATAMKLNVNLRRKWKHEHCIVMNILSSKEKYLYYISKRLSTAISIVCEGFSLMKLLPIEFKIISSVIYTLMCIYYFT